MRKRTPRIAPVLALLLLVVAGCGSRPPKPTVAELELRAAEDLNPDVNGRPSPLRVRLYELKSASGFMSADFFTLYERDKELLGADLLVREEIQVEPGMQKAVTRKLNPEAKYIAVLAPYRDIEKASWRASLEPRPKGLKRVSRVTLQLDRLAVTLLPATDKKRKN